MKNRLINIFKEVLNLSDFTLDRNLTASDIETWDSMNHVILILNIETEFSISFTLSEMAELKNIGDLIDLIIDKTGESL
jgi:acyl carrier protein